ncbi:FtsQ-type POTRA domain-containing protein [Weissella diestrammenae]|uniref:Cell division protein DivIB n=1 Tax=Weissella diestrammenae TaxID=1162633 RepID=A0A7G9T635_9LACO|nr:cell division protein FtsQ/DivIB [Weissella diestrammenae]MCM0582396.1 cell division protein FtsQ/DivIB [Weissella diestrammenae]QNN75560.1 FtsQ-type POTRA domain-containing protein [Weissella diestrammenae]
MTKEEQSDEKILDKTNQINTSKKITQHLDELLGLTEDQNQPELVSEQSHDKQSKWTSGSPVFSTRFVSTHWRHVQRKLTLTMREKHAIIMLLVLLVCAIVLTWMISPLGKAKQIEVIGNSDLTRREVLNTVGINHQTAMSEIIMEKSHYLAQAKQNPQIQQVQIKVTKMNTVQIQVKEVVKVGFIRKNNQYHYILADGKSLQQPINLQQTRNLPIYNQFKSDTTLAMVAKQIGQLSPALRNGISEVVWSPTKDNPQRIMMFMDDGNEVLVNAKKISDNMKYYPGMVVQVSQKGVVDLQVGAYFKPYGQ